MLSLSQGWTEQSRNSKAEWIVAQNQGPGREAQGGSLHRGLNSHNSFMLHKYTQALDPLKHSVPHRFN